MERTRQWRVGLSRAGRVHRGNSGGRRLRVAAATGAMVAVTMPVLSADGAVGTGRSIEVFTGSDMIGLAGYPPNSRVRIEVVRHGFVVGYATKWTDSLGGIEINHVGGLAGDCFDSPSPDLQPNDTIRATVLKRGGTRDTSVVRGVWIDDMDFGASTITVSGHVALTGPGAVDPAAGGLELRINKDLPWGTTEDKDLRVEITPNEDGTWSRTLDADDGIDGDDVPQALDENETVLEWSDASATELTIAEYGEIEPIEGCLASVSDPTAPQLLGAQDSGKVGDHVTNVARGLTFSGLAGSGETGAPGPGQSVTLQVDGADADVVTADSDGVYTFTGVNLRARATPHTVRVITPQGVAGRLVTVDNRAPGVRVRRFGRSPLHLDGRQKLRAVYRLVEGATLRARIDHVNPSGTVRTFARRSAAPGITAFTWNGKNSAGRDVSPGRYRLVLEATDTAGNVTLLRNSLRVVR